MPVLSPCQSASHSHSAFSASQPERDTRWCGTDSTRGVIFIVDHWTRHVRSNAYKRTRPADESENNRDFVPSDATRGNVFAKADKSIKYVKYLIDVDRGEGILESKTDTNVLRLYMS